MVRVVVSSHYLWKVSVAIGHVRGTIYPQHRHQRPILPHLSGDDMSWSELEPPVSVSCERLKFSHESCSVIGLKPHGTTMSRYPRMDYMIARLFC